MPFFNHSKDASAHDPCAPRNSRRRGTPQSTSSRSVKARKNTINKSPFLSSCPAPCFGCGAP
eukprot:1993693-Pyramimonas_sp.AAC.1